MNTRLSSSSGRFLPALLAVILSLAWSQALRAQTAIYLKIDGLHGSVSLTQPPGIKDTIELASFELNTERAIGPASGGIRDGEAPLVSEVIAVMPFDAVAYAKLFKESVAGSNKKASIIVVTGTGANALTPIIINLENVLVSTWRSSASKGDAGAGYLSVSLNFTKIEIQTFRADPATGKPAKGSTSTYDVATRTVS